MKEEIKARKFLSIRLEGWENRVYKVWWIFRTFRHIFKLGLEINHDIESYWMGFRCVKGPFPAVMIDITWYWLWGDCNQQQSGEAVRTMGLFSFTLMTTVLNTSYIWHKLPFHRHPKQRSRIDLKTWKPCSHHLAQSLGGNLKIQKDLHGIFLTLNKEKQNTPHKAQYI